jgi:hypothetical protein
MYQLKSTMLYFAKNGMGAISGEGLFPIANSRDIEHQANKMHGDTKEPFERSILEQIGDAAHDICIGKSVKRVVSVPEKIFQKFSL